MDKISTDWYVRLIPFRNIRITRLCRAYTPSFCSRAILASQPITMDKSVGTLAWVTALCSWAKDITVTVPLSTQVYKWVRANLMLEDNRAVD